MEESLTTRIPASPYFSASTATALTRRKEYIGRLLETIEERGDIRLPGDYICEVVAEVPMDYAGGGACSCASGPGPPVKTKNPIDLISVCSLYTLAKATKTLI